MPAEDDRKMTRRPEKNQPIKQKRNRKKKLRIDEFPVPVLVPTPEAPPPSLPTSSINCYNPNHDNSLAKTGRFTIKLKDLERLVPWDQLTRLLLPTYPEHGVDKRRHYPLQSMMRIHLLQRLHALSDSGIELALYELPVIRQFAQLNCSHDGIPDIPTIQRFRLLVAVCAQAANLYDDVLHSFD